MLVKPPTLFFIRTSRWLGIGPRRYEAVETVNHDGWMQDGKAFTPKFKSLSELHQHLRTMDIEAKKAADKATGGGAL